MLIKLKKNKFIIYKEIKFNTFHNFFIYAGDPFLNYSIKSFDVKK